MTRWLGCLAGAGLVGLLDGALRIPADTPGFWREATILVVLGNLLAASVAALLLTLIARRREGAGEHAAYWWLGVAVGLGPFLSFKTPNLAIGLAFVALALFGARWLGARPAPGRRVAVGLAAVPLLALAALWIQPPSMQVELPPSGLAASGIAPAEQPPDLVLVSVDTLRADAVSNPPGPLPTIALLRERGRWADYGLSSSCATRPGHLTMLSGLGALEHAVASNENRLGDDVLMVAQRLQGAGYRTAAVVSNAVIRGAAGFGAGFEVYDETPIARRGPRQLFLDLVKGHTWLGWCGVVEPPAWLAPRLFGRGSTVLDGDRGNGRHTTDHALALLAELQQGVAPYFLFVHYMDPHAPYWPPDSTAGRYYRGQGVPEDLAKRGIALGEYRMVNALGRRLGGAAERDAAARQLLEELRDLYHEEVLFIDAMLGELLAAIDASGRPTVFLFTSDHGEHFGEHDLVLHRNSVYEPLVRVPFFLLGPGIEPGEFPVVPHLEDVVPTFLSFAGLAEDASLVGRDLRAAAPPQAPHFERYKEHLALRDGPWKLVCTLEEREDATEVVPHGLYELVEDPGETRDRLATEPEVAARLLRAAQRAVDAAALVLSGELDTDDAHLAALEELGYVDGE